MPKINDFYLDDDDDDYIWQYKPNIQYSMVKILAVIDTRTYCK